MDENGECCVCMYKLTLCEFLPCKHKVVCRMCTFFMLKREVLDVVSTASTSIRNLQITCPICRTTCRFIYDSEFMWSISCIIGLNTEESRRQKALYDTILFLLKKKKPCEGDIASSLVNIYKSLTDDTSEKMLLMTVTQTEECLKVVHERRLGKDYKIFNVLVALCWNPWNVDVNLGSHGVCYHGNMGEKPTNILNCFNTICQNMFALKHNSFF